MKQQSFQFEECEIKIIVENEMVWFVGRDILNALEYTSDDELFSAKTFKHVPEEWLKMYSINTTTEMEAEKVLCIHEQGLYFFLGSNDKPKTLSLRQWVDTISSSIEKDQSIETTDEKDEEINKDIEGSFLLPSQLFNYEKRQVRIIYIDDEPWFVAKDICDILEISNSRDAVSRLDEADVGSTDISYETQKRKVSIVMKVDCINLFFKVEKKKPKRSNAG